MNWAVASAAGAVSGFGDLDVAVLGERGRGVAEAGADNFDRDAGVEQEGGVQVPQPRVGWCGAARWTSALW
jgi:hypothetical protein